METEKQVWFDRNTEEPETNGEYDTQNLTDTNTQRNEHWTHTQYVSSTKYKHTHLHTHIYSQTAQAH